MTEVKIRRSHRTLRERLLLWQRAYVAKAVDGHKQFLGRGPTPEAAKEAAVNKCIAPTEADEDSALDRCHNCGQELVEIDNRGQRLNGCITCNLWTAGDAKGWTRAV